MTTGSCISSCAGVLHGMCNAHHFRELQAFVDLAGEDWARRLQQLLRRAHRAVGIAREKGFRCRGSLLEHIRRRYDRLLDEALAYHRALEPLKVPQPGAAGAQEAASRHNLARPPRARNESVLRFLTDFSVPFRNNQAE